MRSRFRALVLGSVLAVLGALLCPVARAATLVDCTADQSALQPAIDAAQTGDTLQIAGTCVGNFLITKDLTLQGSGTLDGDGSGTVLEVRANTTVIDLTITGGVASDHPEALFGQGSGGGIFAALFVHLTLDGSALVTGNEATSGGGIYMAAFGILTMNGSSRVSGNRGSFTTSGGGIFVEFFGGARLNDSSSVNGNVGTGISNWSFTELNGSASVSGNTGGGIFDRGSVVMNDLASVRNNEGTGVYVVFGRDLVMNDFASIVGNTAVRGGGINAEGGGIVLNGSALVSGNTARTAGGGIAAAGPITLNDDASIRRNVVGTDSTPGFGGGIYNQSNATTLNGNSVVKRNIAIGPGADGGGAYLCGFDLEGGPPVTLNGGKIRANKPNNVVYEAVCAV